LKFFPEMPEASFAKYYIGRVIVQTLSARPAKIVASASHLDAFLMRGGMKLSPI
jgi:hypothetical protein